MTAHRSPISSVLLRSLMLVLFLAGISASSAFAQDDQEYKRTYNSALEAAKAKDYAKAHPLFVKAADLAKKAGDNDVADKASKVAAQLDYAFGKNLVAQEKFEEALKHFNNGIQRYPKFADNYLGKALALNKLGRTDESLAEFKKLMQSPEVDVANAAKRALRDNYVYLASTALTRNGATPTRSDAQEAIQHLTAAQDVVEADADMLYYLGEANKALGNYQEAIKFADQALQLHKGSKADKAKIYFMKGEALMSVGNNEAAKAAFSEATYGSYKASAEHYIETL